MDKAQVAALLGRPLTTVENTNFNLYLEIAQESLEELLCIKLCDEGDETRTFDVREGYSTVFTGIFTELTEVKVDGTVTTDYYHAFWDKRSNAYYNSIVLDDCNVSEVEITGSWGFDSTPADLQLLWAQMFANVSKKYKAGGGNVKRKDVRNFSVWLGDLSDDETFINGNKRAIQKYSLCNVGYVLHGRTCSAHGRYGCAYCL